MAIFNFKLISMDKSYTTLKEFYPYYLREHSHPTCRMFHYVGTSLIIGMIIWMFLDFAWWKFLLIPVTGYGFAWIGHFVFEKNKPATFKYPFYSLASDFIMYFHFLTGQIDSKLAQAESLAEQAE